MTHDELMDVARRIVTEHIPDQRKHDDSRDDPNYSARRVASEAEDAIAREAGVTIQRARTAMVQVMRQRRGMSEAARTLGSLGGSANTPAQNAARAQNAQHAGRPRKNERTYYARVVSVRDDGTVDEWDATTAKPDRAHMMRDRDERIMRVRAGNSDEARRLLSAMRQGSPISEDVL